MIDSENKKNILLAIIFFAFYTFILIFSSPIISLKDSGEIGSSAFVLGVPHATGFPVLMELLKLSSFLTFGEIALRMTLISIICAGLVIVFLWLIMNNVGARHASLLLIFGCLSLVLCENFFLHASTIEVYMATLLLTSSVMFLALRYYENKDSRLIALMMFLIGLSFGLHVSAWYCTSFILLSILIFSKEKKDTFLKIIKFLPLFLLGAAVIAYIPISAERFPQRNWGNPQTLERFLLHATGMNIVHAFREEVIESSLSDIMDNLKTFYKFIIEQMIVLTPLFVAGSIALFKTRLFAFMIFGILIIDLFFSVKINPMGTTDLQTGVPFMLGFSILCGIGSMAIYNFVSDKIYKLRFLVPVCILVLFIPVAGKFIETSVRTTNYFPHDMTEEFMINVPSESLILTQSDNMNSLLIFQKIVEHQRPDVLHAVKQHLADKYYIDDLMKYNNEKFFREKFQKAYMELNAPDNIETNKIVLSALIKDNIVDKSVFYETGEYALDKDYYLNLYPDFPIFELIFNVFDRSGKITGIEGKCLFWKDKTDRWGRFFLSDVFNNLGILQNFNGQPDSSIISFKKAIEISSENPKAYYNLGVMLLKKGLVEDGIDRIKKALELQPNYKKAKEKLGTDTN